ncbi:N-acetyl sugar amidotransferase [Gammaproteobacteria bacterium]|nr:N-acetyl sugar amidotransferase [Gammaproteobacteria bacterium]
MEQICNKCVMDTSDPDIIFNSKGICNYCINFESKILPHWNYGLGKEKELEKLSQQIKKSGKGKDFDCIIGLSGGLDSSYTAYVATKVMDLKPLLFHVDAGWNTDRAVGNIKKLVESLGLDLYTDVINWEEMKDLQLSFFKAQLADQDIPQDAAFFSGLYRFARKYKIKYVLTGGNYSTECCREPEEWGAYPGIDKRLINDIHNQFGKRKLQTFPLLDILQYKAFYQYILGMKVIKPLDLYPYNKREAENTLTEFCGWEPFKHKHHESRFTRFYEDYWMPRKFGYEKRRAHFSSLIMTGQLDRDAAIKRLKTSELSEFELAKEFEFVASKLDISTAELQSIFEGENKTYKDYKNKRFLIGIGAKILDLLGIEKRFFK